MGIRRIAGLFVVALAGVAAALAITAPGGSASTRVCIVKETGVVREAGRAGCGPTELPLTISGQASKGSGKTLTINGVAFKKGSGKTITINGVAFKKGSGNTLTINGTAFKRSKSGTLTINGIVFTKDNRGPTGPPGLAGAEGRIGPTGPPGIPYGPPPVEVAGPVAVGSAATTLTSLTFTGTEAHRLLVTGGFNAVCNPCDATTRATPRWGIDRQGGGALVSRRMAPIAGSDSVGASISEIIVTPTVCGPCTFDLVATFPGGGGGGAGGGDELAVSGIRLGLLDLGPVSG